MLSLGTQIRFSCKREYNRAFRHAENAAGTLINAKTTSNKEQSMHTYFVTFSRPNGTTHDCYTTIEAETEFSARKKLKSACSCISSFCYTSPERAGVDQGQLPYVPLAELSNHQCQSTWPSVF